jgi:hypothetical protein
MRSGLFLPVMVPSCHTHLVIMIGLVWRVAFFTSQQPGHAGLRHLGGGGAVSLLDPQLCAATGSLPGRLLAFSWP